MMRNVDLSARAQIKKGGAHEAKQKRKSICSKRFITKEASYTGEHSSLDAGRMEGNKWKGLCNMRKSGAENTIIVLKQ